MNKSQPLIKGDGQQTRDFTYVENVIQANVNAMLTDEPAALNQVYNIACGERTSILELLSTLNELFNTHMQPVFTERSKSDVLDSLGDISRANQFLHYKPHVSLKEGLGKTCRWFQENDWVEH